MSEEVGGLFVCLWVDRLYFSSQVPFLVTNLDGLDSNALAKINTNPW